MKNASYGINSIISGFNNWYNFDAAGFANIFQPIGYTANQVADALHDFHYTVTEVGNALKSSYKLGANAMADALEHAEYTVNEVGNFLKDGLKYADSTVDSALKAAGYATDAVDGFMKDAFGWGKDVIDEIGDWYK